MVPLLVLVAGTLLFRGLGALRPSALSRWRDATRLGLVAMFVFTGSTHFTDMKHDYAAMVPPPFTGQLWIIYATGLLEIAGAMGLLAPRTRRLAGVCLCLLLVGLLPANVYAAMNAVPFRGASPTDVWLRGLIQVLFLIALWWSAVAQPSNAKAS